MSYMLIMIRISKSFCELDYQIFYYSQKGRNTCEREIFRKISDLQPENAIKTNSVISSFKGFFLLFRNSSFKEQLFLAYGAGSCPQHARFPEKDSFFLIQLSSMSFQKEFCGKIAALNLLKTPVKRQAQFLIKLHDKFCLAIFA